MEWHHPEKCNWIEDVIPKMPYDSISSSSVRSAQESQSRPPWSSNIKQGVVALRYHLSRLFTFSKSLILKSIFGNFTFHQTTTKAAANIKCHGDAAKSCTTSSSTTGVRLFPPSFAAG